MVEFEQKFSRTLEKRLVVTSVGMLLPRRQNHSRCVSLNSYNDLSNAENGVFVLIK